MAIVDFNAIMNRINILTTFMNTVITLSKQIFQLPDATAGDKLVAVWNLSSLATEKFNLSDALAGAYAITNGMIAFGEITRVVNDFTFDVGFQGRINGVIYQNAAPIDRTIASAGTGNHRMDIAVLDTNNDIYIIQGFNVPLADSVEQPTPEPDTLFICSFLITEDTVSDPGFDGTYLFLQKVRIRKGYGNTNPANQNIDEAGDIYQFGFIRTEDSVKCFADFAVWKGNDINDNTDYADMTVKEITFEP